MSKPRELEWICDCPISEMDIVRGIVGHAKAYGLSIADLERQVYGDGVETLEDWDAALQADLNLLAIRGRG